MEDRGGRVALESVLQDSLGIGGLHHLHVGVGYVDGKSRLPAREGQCLGFGIRGLGEATWTASARCLLARIRVWCLASARAVEREGGASLFEEAGKEKEAAVGPEEVPIVAA